MRIPRRSFVLLALALVAGCGDSQPKVKPRPRDELKKALERKTRAEVKEILGKPDSTTGTAGGTFERWHYKEVSYDPVADRVDSGLTVTFGSGDWVIGVEPQR